MTRHAFDYSNALLRLPLAIAAAAMATALVPLAPEPTLPGLKAMLYALATVCALIIFQPRARASLLSAWCLAGTLSTGAVLLVDPATRPLYTSLPTLLLALFLLSTTFVLLARYLSNTVIIALFALLALAPVWAAPLVEVLNNPTWLNQIVINASPLTVIATTLDLDYLRSEWFYANSALGSMRYAYPHVASVLAVLAIVPVAALVIEQAAPAFRKEAHP